MTTPFALTGWAIDGSNPAGTGVDAVDVSGYHNFGSGSPLLSLGSATYSGSRPAVSALYGARFDPSGYTKTLSTLTAGWYWFVVSSHNVRDNSWTVRTQTAFVDIPLSTRRGRAAHRGARHGRAAMGVSVKPDRRQRGCPRQLRCLRSAAASSVRSRANGGTVSSRPAPESAPMGHAAPPVCHTAAHD